MLQQIFKGIDLLEEFFVSECIDRNVSYLCYYKYVSCASVKYWYTYASGHAIMEKINVFPCILCFGGLSSFYLHCNYFSFAFLDGSENGNQEMCNTLYSNCLEGSN